MTHSQRLYQANLPIFLKLHGRPSGNPMRSHHYRSTGRLSEHGRLSFLMSCHNNPKRNGGMPASTPSAEQAEALTMPRRRQCGSSAPNKPASAALASCQHRTESEARRKQGLSSPCPVLAAATHSRVPLPLTSLTYTDCKP